MSKFRARKKTTKADGNYLVIDMPVDWTSVPSMGVELRVVMLGGRQPHDHEIAQKWLVGEHQFDDGCSVEVRPFMVHPA